MYKITCIIHKPGGMPIKWTRYSDTELSITQCERLMSYDKAVGKSHGCRVTLTDFSCTELKDIIRKTIT